MMPRTRCKETGKRIYRTVEDAQRQIDVMPGEAYVYPCWHCAQYHITRGVETPIKRYIRENITPFDMKRVVDKIRRGESIGLGNKVVQSGVGPLRVTVHYAEGYLVGYHNENEDAPIAWIFEKHKEDMTEHYNAIFKIARRIRSGASMPLEKVSNKTTIHIVKHNGENYTVAYHNGKSSDADAVEILHRQPIE